MSKDSTLGTILVAFILCIVCSVIVSGAAVFLKPEQQKNKLLDKQKNILLAAGLYEDGDDIAEKFNQIEKRVIDIKSGSYMASDFDVDAYDQRKAARDPKSSVALEGSIDIAGIKRLPNNAEVYIVKDNQGDVETVILPVSAYGLWSTMHGFLALEKDLNTVAGLAFYDHGETPGLGGEIDNPKWKAQWLGKKIFDDKGKIAAKLKKGGMNPNVAYEKEHYVDGLSGATLTSNGVNNLFQFWLGENGYGPYLSKLSTGGGQHNSASESSEVTIIEGAL